jgi:bifunctional UDP-N-acetylglucosamine pyrophosphorylase / glucosamine-1-phosphate N-acetyltransferase
MRSSRPKPLHQLCGRPMVVHVLDSLAELHADWAVMVVGHGAEHVVGTMNDSAPLELPLHFVEQTTQRGTGDAVSIALASLPEQLSDESENADIVILPGDTPLLEASTVARLVDQHRYSGAAATLLTVKPEDPTGYGRIIRNQRGNVVRIVEERDANEEERRVDEVNTSVICFKTSLLGPALRSIQPSNAQNEIYLTDTIAVLADAGHSIETMVAPDVGWAVGVNDRVQLATAEAELRRRINESWMGRGVTMIDPSNTYIDTGVQIGQDVCLHPGVRLTGTTVIGDHCEIGPATTLENCQVGAGVRIARTDATGASIGNEATVGPYAVLEPGTQVPANGKVSAFTHMSEGA